MWISNKTFHKTSNTEKKFDGSDDDDDSYSSSESDASENINDLTV